MLAPSPHSAPFGSRRPATTACPSPLAAAANRAVRGFPSARDAEARRSGEAMAAAPARALAADKRWGFAAAAAAVAKAAPTRTHAAGVHGTAPEPTNLPTQRSTIPSADKRNTPEPNAWGSSSLLSLKNGGDSDSFGNINDRPSSRASSSTSTDGSDLLDSPLAWGRTSHNSTSAASRPQTSELGSRILQFPHSQNSFSDVLKAPLSTIAIKRPTSHGKGFALSVDDFPVLVSKNSEADHKKGHSFQGRHSFSSVITARDEQRKLLITGGDHVSTANFPKKAQTPDICMPPPCIDYWHPPPDHPPDRDEICHGGAALYSLCKPADMPSSFPVQSFPHNGQSLLGQGEARHSPRHGVSFPENSDSCSAHALADAVVKSLPHLILGKVKVNNSKAVEKQPVIKKDMELLEKIKCLNIKARNLRARNISEISLCRESKVEHPKSIDVKEALVANDVPFSTVSSDISSAFEGHVTEFHEARKPGKSADNHVYGVGNTSRNRWGSSAIDTASDIWGHRWEEHSPVDSLPVSITNIHEDQPFAGNSSKQSLKSNDTPGKSFDYHVYGGRSASRNRHGSSAEDISFSISEHVWEDHPTVDSISVMKNIHQDQPFSGNTSQQVHVRTADFMINYSDYEMQHSRRELSNQNAKQLHEEKRGQTQQKAKPIVGLEDSNRPTFVKEKTVDDILNPRGSVQELSAQHEKELQEEEREKIQQKAKANAKLEELNRSLSIKNQESNDVPLEDDKILSIQNAGRGGTTSHDSSISDTCCTIYTRYLNAPLTANGIKNTVAPISSTPVSDVAGVNRGPLIHNVMLEHMAHKIAAESHDSSAPKHLHVEITEGQIQKQDCISRCSTPASETADATKGPSVHNAISSAKKTDVNMMEHVDQKGASQSYDNSAPMQPQMKDKGRQIHSRGRILRGYTPASGSAGVNKGSLVHNVMTSANNTKINRTEHIARKSASQSHENSAPKHLQMENRQRQAYADEKVLRERSNIAESTENVTTVAMTHVDRRNAEAKSNVDLSTQSKKIRLVLPLLSNFGSENAVTETSCVHKTHIPGVLINSSIIPAQAASVRGFTVGSIMLGDASLASSNQDEKTVPEEVHDETTDRHGSPKQTKQSGKNRHGVQNAKDSHGSDSIVCTQVKERNKKEQSEVGGLNCMAMRAPTKPSGNESIGPQTVVPANTSEMEKHAHKPAYEVLHVQNLRKMIPAEKQATPCDKSSISKVETQGHDQETVGTSTTAKDANTKTEIQEDKKHSTHIGRSSASLNQTTTNESASVKDANTESEIQEDKKHSTHIGRSSASLKQTTTNESASVGPDHNEQEASSLVLKIMQDLSDKLEQIEKQLESSTHVAPVNHSQPTQSVSLPGYTWGERRMSQSHRQYHVSGQGNMWINYAANSHMDVSGMTPGAAALPTTLVLPGPFSVPTSNTLDGSSTPGWMWDGAEGLVISDQGSVPDLGTTAIERGRELMQNVYRDGHMDLQGMQQAFGGMAYGGAAAMIPEASYHTGLESQQLSPAWLPHGQPGTGVYLLGMYSGSGRQIHGGAVYTATRSTVGAGHPDYQLVPVASPGADYTGSAMMSAEHPAASTWGAAYSEHVYYASLPDYRRYEVPFG